MVSVEDIKKLRELTEAPVGDCRAALEQAKGNFQKAAEFLRSLGKAKAEKKAEREVKSGQIFSYIHQGGRVGTLIDVRCETDFVARSDAFSQLGRELCLQIAAMNPLYVRKEEVPAEVLEKYREEKKEKELSELILLDQPYIKNQDISVRELVGEYVGKLGENIEIRRFIRYAL